MHGFIYLDIHSDIAKLDIEKIANKWLIVWVFISIDICELFPDSDLGQNISKYLFTKII